jgi:hypothetical protein
MTITKSLGHPAGAFSLETELYFAFLPLVVTLLMN